jgi:Bacterial Ig-like domain (group 2)
MRTAPSILLAALATLSLGCSDTTGPELSLDDSSGPPIVLTPASATIRGGESVQLNATIKRGASLLNGESTVTWFSTNESVATVSSAGMVHGVRAGTAQIVAVAGSARARATVTVLDDALDDGRHQGCLKPLLEGETLMERPTC